MSAGTQMTRLSMLSGGSSSLSIRSKGEDWLNSLRVAPGPLCEFTLLSLMLLQMGGTRGEIMELGLMIDLDSLI